MKTVQIQLSANFKKMTTRAVGSILLFLLVYVLLFASAALLTIACGYAGLMLIILKPMFLTLAIGAGLVSMGLLILIFLVKFMFKKHVVDRSHLTEIKKADYPELFAFIKEIVLEADTRFPKKIYLSAQVNAAVFYDSSFWSMFLPIRKNLEIGLGLVNTISKSEFKAILAHEFGHFSQRSMKVGSYVYNVNQVIYNMLYDNASYQSIIETWSSISNYINFFISIAIKIVNAIQVVLRKMYDIVNVNYMALSREMEFHADEIAANVAGSAPLITSLQRMELADKSFNAVLDFYNGKIKENKITHQLFSQQQYVLNFYAKESMLPFENDLPVVTETYLQRYNKSKLVINNQWASHPATDDRVRALEKLNIVKQIPDGFKPASSLFNNYTEVEKLISNKLFTRVNYEGEISTIETSEFIGEFTKNYQQISFSKIFNNYYDDKSPAVLNLDAYAGKLDSVDHLFSDAETAKVYNALALEADIKTLETIVKPEYRIKTFDYDGEKYVVDDIPYLLPKLNEELEKIEQSIKTNDEKIYQHFLWLSETQSDVAKLKYQYESVMLCKLEAEKKLACYQQIIDTTAFVQHTTPYDTITANLATLADIEVEFRRHLRNLQQMDIFQPELNLNQEAKANIEVYLSKEWVYFIKPDYEDQALAVLFNVLRSFLQIVTESQFNRKKELLAYFATMHEQSNISTC